MENYIHDTEKHALAILDENSQWDWHGTNLRRILDSGKEGGRSLRELSTPKFLYHLIAESQKFGGKVLNQFWKQLGMCDEKLEENIKSLKEEKFVSAEKSFEVLFRGLHANEVDFDPVVHMSSEYFVHLGVQFMNPGGKKSTEHSVSESISEDTNRLLEEVNKEGDFGTRKQYFLKKLSIKRDGKSCLLTGFEFVPFDEYRIYPTLAHIIANSAHEKPRTLECIAIFAGNATRNDVMQMDAHRSYNNLKWGIQAQGEGGETKCFFRKVPAGPHSHSAGIITLADGDEIHFGEGSEGSSEQLNKGPLASLCNLQLAVARVLKLSGAADTILQWKDEADDDDGCYRPSVASGEFWNMLDAKLFLSGRAVIARSTRCFRGLQRGWQQFRYVSRE